MSYPDKRLIRMIFDEYDFGNDANEVFSFRLPYDEHGVAQKGRLVNVGVMVTEVFACDSTVASVRVGTAGNNDAFAELNIPDATADEDCYDVSDDTDAILDEDIPADTLVEVNLIQSTDASSDTGKGIPFIDIYVW